jgi:cell wall-associated NlpC family hydrolase
VATPHAELKHAPALFSPAPIGRRAPRAVGRIRSGLLIGATAALTLTVLPGTAAAVPGDVTDAAQAAQMVADANHQLEVVTEQLNEAKVQLEQQQAAVASADQAAADAQTRLEALGGQIRQLARSAYTSDGFSRLDVMLTSSSAEEFVHQLGTLDAIAGHTNEQVAQIAVAADAAEQAQATADEAEALAQKSYDDIAAQQKDLEAKIADYQRQYAALTAPQQQQVLAAHGGDTQAVPSGVIAPSAAAQQAVDTALAQVGDPYVWGAGGPDAFDCSGLTQYAYSAAGVSLPHSSSSQSRMGMAVSRSELQPGDLLFFYSPVSHVGMYIGNGQMVHASTSGQPVKVASIDSMPSYNSARRIAG